MVVSCWFFPTEKAGPGPGLFRLGLIASPCLNSLYSLNFVRCAKVENFVKLPILSKLLYRKMHKGLGRCPIVLEMFHGNLIQFRSQMRIALKAIAGNGSKWLLMLLLPFLLYACGYSLPVYPLLEAASAKPSAMMVEAKWRIEVHEGEVPPPFVIQGKSIHIVQHENPPNPIIENYAVAKLEKALQAQGALIVANPSKADFLLEPDFGPNHDAKIPTSEMPIRSNITFTKLVQFQFYKQGQNDFPIASGKIYSTGSGDDLGWNVKILSDSLARGLGPRVSPNE